MTTQKPYTCYQHHFEALFKQNREQCDLGRGSGSPRDKGVQETDYSVLSLIFGIGTLIRLSDRETFGEDTFSWAGDVQP